LQDRKTVHYRVFLNDTPSSRFAQLADGAELRLAYAAQLGTALDESDVSVLSRIFTMMNIAHPNNYMNRSLSVADVITLFRRKPDCCYNEPTSYAVLPIGFSRLETAVLSDCIYAGPSSSAIATAHEQGVPLQAPALGEAPGVTDCCLREPRQRQGQLVAYTDGGSRGNPGPAGYGVILEDTSGSRVDGLSKFLGRQTNNVAEYEALLAALRYALSNGFESLEVRSDSELMVMQILGKYKVKSPSLQELYSKAQELIKQLSSFSINHIRRERNRRADALANDAIDKGNHAIAELHSM
jgi:ribonuclease HI